MAKRPKVARAIQPNAGLRRQYAKKLLNFFHEFERQIGDEIFLHLAERCLIAQDWSLSNPKSDTEKRLLKTISKGVLSALKRDPETFEADIEAFVAKHLFEWVTNASTAATKLALWVARSIAADVTAAQRQAYVASGVPLTLIRKRWTVPIVRQHIGKTAQQRIPMLVDWSVGLITKMLESDAERVKQVILKSLLDGRTVTEVRRLLYATSGFNKDRAYNVSLDQTNKITHGIRLANDEDLGVTQGIWIHVAGQYTSRITHKHMDGKRFDLKKGMYDPSTGKYIQPAELPYCRCVYRSVIDWDAIEKKNNED